MTLKKLSAFLLAGTMMLSLAACGKTAEPAPAPAPAPSTSTPATSTPAEPEKTIVFDISNCMAEGTPGAIGSDKLAELLNATGFFQVTNYNNSQLGTVVDVLDRVIDGDMMLEMVSASDIADPLSIPDLSATMAPFLFDSIEDIDTLTSSDWFEGLAEQAYSKGVKILCPNLISGERFFVTKEPIPTPADMAGMKLRVPANTNYINTFTAFGCSPTPMAVTEVYTSLQQKLIDGLEFPLPNVITNGYYEVAKYIANQDYLKEMNMWVCSVPLWESMSETQQEALIDCCFEASAFLRAEYESQMEAAKTELAELGITFYDIDVEAYRAAAEEYWAISENFSEGLKDTLYEILG